MPDPAGSPQEFVSEPITPVRGAFSPGNMVAGLASLPAAFVWRNRRYEIVECLGHEKVSAAEGGTEGRDVYLRRQVFTVRLDTDQRAVIYLRRQAPPGASPRSARRRWFLYSIEPERRAG